mmetsp:Transcript_14648/g.45867  ORF Transcript_14648/g.45867 Transcript_14648/m.45867 type:complete len:308 (+) Transcript_14648:138-1061(+)
MRGRGTMARCCWGGMSSAHGSPLCRGWHGAPCTCRGRRSWTRGWCPSPGLTTRWRTVPRSSWAAASPARRWRRRTLGPSGGWPRRGAGWPRVWSSTAGASGPTTWSVSSDGRPSACAPSAGTTWSSRAPPRARGCSPGRWARCPRWSTGGSTCGRRCTATSPAGPPPSSRRTAAWRPRRRTSSSACGGSRWTPCRRWRAPRCLPPTAACGRPRSSTTTRSSPAGGAPGSPWGACAARGSPRPWASGSTSAGWPAPCSPASGPGRPPRPRRGLERRRSGPPCLRLGRSTGAFGSGATARSACTAGCTR